MIMADVWKILFLVIGSQLVMVSYWLLAAALFPASLARSRRIYEGHAVRGTLVGAAVTVPTLLLGAALMQLAHPLVKLLAAILLSVPVVLGLVGSAGLCDRVGAGLPSQGDAQQPWLRVLRGGVVLTLAFVLPVIGWFLLLPWTLVSGVGASLGRGWRRAEPEPLR